MPVLPHTVDCIQLVMHAAGRLGVDGVMNKRSAFQDWEVNLTSSSVRRGFTTPATHQRRDTGVLHESRWEMYATE